MASTPSQTLQVISVQNPHSRSKKQWLTISGLAETSESNQLLSCRHLPLSKAHWAWRVLKAIFSLLDQDYKIYIVSWNSQTDTERDRSIWAQIPEIQMYLCLLWPGEVRLHARLPSEGRHVSTELAHPFTCSDFNQEAVTTPVKANPITTTTIKLLGETNRLINNSVKAKRLD